MDETGWAPTRHGGYRRRTRVAQKKVDPRGTGPEARAIASADVKGSEDLGEAWPERSSDLGEVGSSNLPPRTKNKKWYTAWREPLGLPSCPYVIRWRIETPWGSVRLHHWLAPDDDRAKHDHPWSFTTFVLWGGYVDSSPDGDEHLRAPAIRHRAATHQHTVFPDPGGAWTIIVTGPKVRNWGFWVKGKFVKMNKYFLTYGHHPCD